MTVSATAVILAVVLIFAVGYAVGRQVGKLQGFKEGLCFAPLGWRAWLMMTCTGAGSDELPTAAGAAGSVDHWDAGSGRIPAHHVE